ncbi:right-handed parallel beta-helix repeat-containing protein [Haloarcula sp. CBA1130]|uniref:NosD domain-containing protein n=1 Tax=unclassified Haloarcula TaxID=2624677 RepID=UPI001244F6F5|nr:MULTISPECIES: right-handed parallel beta-helix repeat-containing protein [unclassified Haloarcula]KAA9399152.1 right-handed parallel beta-helix repeat-containing protein [Haloarcula sp. CBA1129]KAA9403665.1 right-handed parallel beta-helix repeat-containing protein [Haloarcula sp. CBA1130]
MTVDRNSGSTGSQQSDWRATRRSVLSSIGAAAGIGLCSGTGQAQASTRLTGTGAVYFVTTGAGQSNGSANGNGNRTKYLVLDGGRGSVAFSTGGTADEAFQYAFDTMPDSGGTVIASADTFRFGGPATMGDNTTLTGQQGTRFVASQTGTDEDPAPSASQSNPLPAGHDLIRVRGDNAAVTDIEFDANGTQLNNQAIQADQCDGVYVARNRTVNGFQMALSFTRCTGVTVEHNEVVNPNWYGITSRAAPTGSGRDLRQSNDVVIAGNRVVGVKFNNIAPYNVSNFAVIGNVAVDGGHSLIACSPAQRGTIVGNVCRDLTEFAPDPGGEAGIEIEYKETHLREEVAGTPKARSADITVSGNQVDNCPVGVLARTVPADADDTDVRAEKRPYSFTITGNTVSNASAAGIRLRSGDAGVVATNTVRNAETAIDIDEEFTASIEQGLNVTR